MIVDGVAYNIYIHDNALKFSDVVNWEQYSSVFILCDENTKEHCLPKLSIPVDYHIIEIVSGEMHKNLSTCHLIWSRLIEHGADRKSLMINLGGGVIGDMGGFAASTYMRGIDFIQMTTSLLSQVDASIGGKLGIDYMDLKNIIGLFKDPIMVYINTDFLNTLDKDELKSGYAEIVKHGLIQDNSLWEKISTINPAEHNDWIEIIRHAIGIKRDVVKLDPYEKGLRKILNFGHTVGHAIESIFLSKMDPTKHGFAVIAGIICESHISFQKQLITEFELDKIVKYLMIHYDKLVLPPAELVFENMKSDKKNFSGSVRIASIDGIGSCKYDIECSKEEVIKSLEYYNQL